MVLPAFAAVLAVVIAVRSEPAPVSAVVVSPHAYAKWFLVLSVTFARPGRYHLGRVRIDYTTGGQDGWQYQNIGYTMTIVLHDAKLPAFDGCL